MFYTTVLLAPEYLSISTVSIFVSLCIVIQADALHPSAEQCHTLL